MLVLLAIGFVAGVITAISPCVLPVLPIVFAGGASGGRRRPYAIIAGVVTSFTVSILLITWILRKLGLPLDLMRNVSIVLLLVVAATLVVPRFGELLERPLQRLTRRRGGDLGGGFVLGLSLGFVFAPCGGPILGYIIAQGASLNFGLKPVLLTFAYAIGIAVPMLLIALGGQRLTGAFRARARSLRPVLGVLMAVAALLIAFNVDKKLQTRIGDYTSALQRHTEKTCTARKQLGGRCASRGSSQLADLGSAPGFHKIDAWLNTSGGKPLSIESLRGKVVLVDFWTYSCINCLRTLPHLKAWDATYRKKGLVIVGVHTPEFAFEHVPSNVRKATQELGIRYPVAIDNEYGTWNAYKNFAWPTEYLIDRSGRLRETHEGEGEYGHTESLIRQLLGDRSGAELAVADNTPTHLVTPETYLGYEHGLERYTGSRPAPDRAGRYAFPTDASLDQNTFAYAGSWLLKPEHVDAVRNARLRLNFAAQDVHLVVGGRGKIRVLLDGRRVRTVRIAGIPRLYTLLHFRDDVHYGLLELRFTPALQAYSFTFG
jgi:cytochrome c biogenesis protein CcdA/thiol-disulfide isomerase/thioredoxin